MSIDIRNKYEMLNLSGVLLADSLNRLSKNKTIIQNSQYYYCMRASIKNNKYKGFSNFVAQ